MQYSLLGPLRVTADGGRIELGGLRQRAVLAVLLISADAVVDVDVLIDKVWDGAPPSKPVSSVRAYVANLRRVLGDGRSPDRLLTEGHGYLLRLGDDSLDCQSFEAATDLGRRLLADGDPEAALPHLSRALALWHGEPLSDFRNLSFAVDEVHRLDVVRLDCVEAVFDARLQLGQDAGLVPEISAEVTGHPLRERLWEQLMLALYRAGRRGDALRAHDRMRTVFDRELGVAPGSDAERLAHDIRSEAAHLRRDPTASTKAAPARPRQRPLVGRGHDVRQLDDRLAAAVGGQGSATVIVGESGIGKTALAAETARRAEALGATTLWIGHRAAADLSPWWTWNQVLRELAGRTGDPVHQPAPPRADGDRRMVEAMATAVGALVREPTVVVLDDVHLADPLSRDTLAVLTGALPRLPLLVLATWQHGDAARPGEELSRLLAGADLRSMWLHGLDADRAAELVEHLSGVTPTDAVAGQLVARTGGNPLYLTELTRLLMERRQLDGATAALSADGVPPAVTGVIGGRMAALPADTATALSAAAVLGIAVSSTRVGAVLGVAAHVVEDRLAAAVSAALLVPEQAGRYRFSHGIVRDAVVGRLDPRDRSRLHADVARVLLADAGALDEDAVAGADHAWRAGVRLDAADALTLLGRAAATAWSRSAYREVAELSRRGLQVCERLPDGPDRLRQEADLWLQLASAEAVVTGQTSAAVSAALRRSHEIGSQIGHVTVERALRCLEACGAGRYREGAVMADGLIELFADTGDAVAGSAGYYLRGLTDFAAGDVDGCLDRIETLLHELPPVDWRRHGHMATFDVRGYGVAAWAHALLGEPERARALVATGLELAEGRNDTFGSAILLTSQLQVDAIRGSHAWLAEQAEATVERLTGFGFDQLAGTARIIGGWARALGPAGEDTAEEMRDAIATHSRDGTRIFLPLYYALLADVQAARGDVSGGRATLNRAELTAFATGERVWDAQLSARLSALRHRRDHGRPEDAGRIAE
ncbi:BTAD domain-containing putative transcriptional regulator [Mycobacterium sp. NPDC050041]|uniref:BTAD domain-containing putative transcriptional regulator n=1 Tax=Mycobacterium sp. NPDC050041 TaxID=3364293 RepID=UPI003C2F1F18